MSSDQNNTPARDETAPEAGLLLVISGPSGVGKTTIARALIAQLGGSFSVSATTRAKRNGEVDGTDYIFLTTEQFEAIRDRGELLEYAHVFERDWYGTPAVPVFEQLEHGNLVILDIDVQGALQVRQSMPDACLVFIDPPSDEELLRRLRDRGSEDEATIRRRYDEAQHERRTARESNAYDHFITNDDLELAIKATCDIVQAARKARLNDGPALKAHPAE